MQRFKNILLLFGGDVGTDVVLTRAQELARSNSARLTLVEVVRRLPGDLMSTFVPLSRDERDLQERRVAERSTILERLAVSLRQDGVDVTVDVLRGIPFIEIIKKVIRDGHDLVVMTADSVTGLRKISFGSTSMHLMRKCPCPVWVMDSRAGPRFHRILATIDPPGTNVREDELDLKILQLASSLARTENCALDILHAWDLTGSDLQSSLSEISEKRMAEILAQNSAAHEAAVKELMGEVDFGGVEPNLHLPRGVPWEIIPRFAHDNAVDLIVMGTVTRTGIAGFFIGDTAEHVLQQVRCSVLTVKPEGFVSPVTLDQQGATRGIETV